MADANAALLISNADLTGKRLADAIGDLLGDTHRLEEIERNARSMAILDAEQRIVKLIETAIERRHV